MKVERLIDAFAVGITLMVSEHFFSTFLSSPLTVSTLYKDERSKEEVKKYLALACLASLGFGAIMTYLLDDKLAIATAFIICLIYTIVYMKAMS